MMDWYGDQRKKEKINHRLMLEESKNYTLVQQFREPTKNAAAFWNQHRRFCHILPFLEFEASVHS